MFERFTDRARRVVVLAQEEARMLNHNYIGTEHILLGLIHEGEGVAAKALESMGISLAAVRGEKESAIDVQDFEKASALRDKEKELLVARAAREQEWKAAADAGKRAPQADDTDIVAVTEEAERLRGEVARLEALLRQHGVEPGDAGPGGAAPGGAAPGGASPGGASP